MDPRASSTLVSKVDTVVREQVDLKYLLAILTTRSSETVFSSAHTFITRKELLVQIGVNCYHSWCTPVNRDTPYSKVRTEYRYHRTGYDHGEVLEVIQALSTCPTLTHARFCVDEWIRKSKYEDLMSVVCKTLYNDNLIVFQLAIGTRFDSPNILLVGQLTKVSPSDHVSSILEKHQPFVRSLKVQLTLAGSTKKFSLGIASAFKWETPMWCLSVLRDHLQDLETVSTKISKNVLEELVLSDKIEAIHPDEDVAPALVKVATTQLHMNPNLLKLSFNNPFLLNNRGAKAIAKALRINTSLKELSVNCWMSAVGYLVSPFRCNKTGKQGNNSLHALKIRFSHLYIKWPYSQGSIMKEVASMLKTNTTLTHVEIYPLYFRPKGGNHKKTAEHMCNLVNQLKDRNSSFQYLYFGIWNHTSGLWTLQRIGADLQTTFKGVPYTCWKDREPAKEYTVQLRMIDI